jgi:cyanophycinase
MAIGGAEDKLGAKRVLRRFVAESGGRNARIVVCPTASALGDEVIGLYQNLFGRLGAAEVVAARPENRSEAQKPELVESVERATGIFFTGGNQMKLSAIIRGTAFGDSVRYAYERGVIVAGTSAGASVMSEHMIGYGSSGDTPKHRIAGMAQGLGLLPGTIVDQHFGQRDRFGRLIAVVAASPDLLGIGLDEDTAVLVWDEELFEVVGSGSAFCVDMRGATSDAQAIRATSPFMVSCATVHFLPAGFRFDLVNRRLAEANPPADPAPTQPEALPTDLTQLSRRVAAEGVDDKVVARNARRRRRALETKEQP